MKKRSKSCGVFFISSKRVGEYQYDDVFWLKKVYRPQSPALKRPKHQGPQFGSSFLPGLFFGSVCWAHADWCFVSLGVPKSTMPQGVLGDFFVFFAGHLVFSVLWVFRDVSYGYLCFYVSTLLYFSGFWAPSCVCSAYCTIEIDHG